MQNAITFAKHALDLQILDFDLFLSKWHKILQLLVTCGDEYVGILETLQARNKDRFLPLVHNLVLDWARADQMQLAQFHAKLLLSLPVSDTDTYSSLYIYAHYNATLRDVQVLDTVVQYWYIADRIAESFAKKFAAMYAVLQKEPPARVSYLFGDACIRLDNAKQKQIASLHYFLFCDEHMTHPTAHILEQVPLELVPYINKLRQAHELNLVAEAEQAMHAIRSTLHENDAYLTNYYVDRILTSIRHRIIATIIIQDDSSIRAIAKQLYWPCLLAEQHIFRDKKFDHYFADSNSNMMRTSMLVQKKFVDIKIVK